MITLPDGKICNNLPEQVAKNAKDIFEIAQQWDPYKEQLEADFEMLAAYLADMSSAAVGAIAGQDIAPANVAATGNITSPSIIETMTGYNASSLNANVTYNYLGVVKNGNKLTIAMFIEYQPSSDVGVNIPINLGYITLPSSVANKLATTTIQGVNNICNVKEIDAYYGLADSQVANLVIYRFGSTLDLKVSPKGSAFITSRNYLMRIEVTFLLSDNLAA